MLFSQGKGVGNSDAGCDDVTTAQALAFLASKGPLTLFSA
jgi:hypothetical protein